VFGVRAAVSDEDRRMERAAAYVAFADRWQWTPDTVDDLPAWLYDRMLAVAVIRDEVEEDRQRAAMPNTPGG
jgi:hypothetical protein